MGTVTLNNLRINDQKYIVFKRSEFFEFMGEFGLPPWHDHDGELIGVKVDCAELTEKMIRKVGETELVDAVVIRRQDKFASPCLLTYAAMIGMVADNCGNLLLQEDLKAIADYFQRQGELAGEEGYKLPTI